MNCETLHHLSPPSQESVLPSYVYLFHRHNSECIYTYTSGDCSNTLSLQNGLKSILKAFSLGDMPPHPLALQPVMYQTFNL